MTVVAIPSQKALLMCPYVSAGKFSVLAPRCSRALLHNLQPTSDCRLIFASHLATGMVLKALRGEPANEGADILADKAILDPGVGKECCKRTNQAVF